jgi:hypothetical protein
MAEVLRVLIYMVATEASGHRLGFSGSAVRKRCLAGYHSIEQCLTSERHGRSLNVSPGTALIDRLFLQLQSLTKFHVFHNLHSVSTLRHRSSGGP